MDTGAGAAWVGGGEGLLLSRDTGSILAGDGTFFGDASSTFSSLFSRFRVGDFSDSSLFLLPDLSLSLWPSRSRFRLLEPLW